MLFKLFNWALARHKPSQAPVVGARLQSIGRQIWVADRELLMMGGLSLPIRMVVAANDSGELLCYSPVALDEPTIEAVAGIGDVRWIVAPNPHHVLFAADCLRRFPDAQLLGVESIGDCATEILEASTRIGGHFEALAVNLRPDFRELIVYHDLSETLIVSDLLFNIHAGTRRLEWFLRLNGAWQRAGNTRLQRLLFLRDRQGLIDFYEWGLARPFVRITMSHGHVINDGAREVFYQTFHPYLAGRPY